MDDGEITDEVFNNIEQEIENYESMNSNILNEYKFKTDLIKVFKIINK